MIIIIILITFVISSVVTTMFVYKRMKFLIYKEAKDNGFGYIEIDKEGYRFKWECGECKLRRQAWKGIN